MNVLRVSVLAMFFMIIVTGCGKKVTRIQENEMIDLSGEWNDTDSRLVAEEMIEDCLSRSWYSEYSNVNRPTVIVGTVRNKSHEHINTETFVNDMQRELINSGKVDFVAGKSEREELRDEKKDQQVHSSEETMKEQYREKAADLMLKGSINTIIDKEGKKSVKYYQVDLQLIDLESNRKVWIGSKKIKKFVKDPSARM
ncbi:MAG: penicillin-binding protein activator LpoB [Fibrobacterota bacterium]